MSKIMYRRLRAEGYPASAAKRVADLSDAIDWQDVYDSHVIATGRVGQAELVVYVDDEPYDWGDVEPTDDERGKLEVIGLGVRVTGEDDDLDACWGYGYLHGDWERAAVEFACDMGYPATVERELANRADAAARDIVTIG